MKQFKRYGFSTIVLAAGLLLATSVWAEDATSGGKVENVNTADQSFTLVATPKGVPAGSAEVHVTSDTDFVGVSSLEALKDGDRVEVKTGKQADGEMEVGTVTKV